MTTREQLLLCRSTLLGVQVRVCSCSLTYAATTSWTADHAHFCTRNLINPLRGTIFTDRLASVTRNFSETQFIQGVILPQK